MTGDTYNALRVFCRDSGVHFVGLRTICTQEILVTSGAVASGATGRHFSGIIAIPMAEGFGIDGVMRR
jgi:hypothetical protein